MVSVGDKSHRRDKSQNVGDKSRQPCEYVHNSIVSDSIIQRVNHSNSRKGTTKEIFKEIIHLNPGEALVFAPSAMTAIGNLDGSSVDGSTKFYIRVRIRSRLSDDGGCSVLAG